MLSTDLNKKHKSSIIIGSHTLKLVTYNLERKDRWHMTINQRSTVLINDEAKVLWHVEIQHDHKIEARPDIEVN